MNPAFIILLIIICIAVWFLTSKLYEPIGKLFYRIGKNVVDEMNDEEREENKE